MMLDSTDQARPSASCRSPEAHIDDDPRAFARLYRSYVGFTWRVVGQLGVPSHAIDDVVQEVWLVVHRRLPSFEGRSAVKSWLFGVSLNVARNQRRSDWRRQKHLPELSCEVTRLDPEDPERIREGWEAWERVERFLSTLDDRRRTIFVHQLIENRSALETAEAVGIDVLAVYRQVRFLRSSFRRWLCELDGDAVLAPQHALPRGARRSPAFRAPGPCSGPLSPQPRYARV
jgi:RNA polymerase sigma-70 factor (ECF subfamily)